MAIDFPVATTVGQTYTDPASGSTFVVAVVGPPAQWVGSGSSTNLDATYLRKDASNDPVTGTLTVTPSTNVEGLVVTQGAAQTAAALRITNEGSGNTLIAEDSSNPDSTPFVINSTGRVGIGTSTPAHALDVAGGNIAADDVDGRLIAFAASDTFSASVTAANYGLTRGASGTNTVGLSGFEGLSFYTFTQERLRIDSSGRLLVGTSTSYAIGGTDRRLQVHGTDAAGSTVSATRWSADNNAPRFVFGKARGSLGTFTAVIDDDNLGLIEFSGANGTDLSNIGASIGAFVDGVPFTSGDTTDLPGRLVFSTTADGSATPTERMRITQSGNTLFGCTTIPSASVAGAGFIRESEGRSTLITSSSSTASNILIGFYNPNGLVGDIRTDGNATSYNTSSDYRLKENVVPLIGAIDRVNQLQVYRFNFIADPDKTVDGFIAHEAQAVVPECVTGTKDQVDSDDNPVYQGIDQSKLVPLLTAALQEALAEIESLKARVAALEAA